MAIGELCNREVVVVGRDVTVLEAAKLMRRYHVGDLVVIDERGGERIPTGIVTDRDVVIEVVAEEVDPKRVTVADVMGAELATVGEDEDAIEVMGRMRAHGVRRMPVVNARGGLEGIITVDDLIDLFSEQMQDLAALIRREQLREKQARSLP